MWGGDTLPRGRLLPAPPPPAPILTLFIGKTNPKEFWKLIDRFNNEGGTPSEKSGNISPEDWSNYFNRLLNSNKVDCTLDDSKCLHFSCTSITDYQIKICELQSAMKPLKSNTSSGLDRISNKLLKQSTPRLQECICRLFNIILSNEKYPSQWRENLLKPIDKKEMIQTPEITEVL